MKAGLQRSEHFEQGFGHAVVFAPASRKWAAAGTGALHLWDGSVLTASVAIPGYQHGNASFDADGASVRVGRWVVDATTGAARSTDGNADLLVTHIEGPAASYPERFSEAAVFWGPGGDRAVVLTQYRPPRGLGPDDAAGVSPPAQALLVDGTWEHVVALLDAELDPFAEPAVAVGLTHLALAGTDLRILALESGNQVGRRAGAGAPWVAVCFGEGGHRLAAVGDDGAVAVWSEPDGSQIAGWAAPGPAARAIAYHAGDDLVATATRSGTVTVWDAEGSEMASASVERDVQGLAFDPSGRLFVSTSPPNQSIDVFEFGG